MVIKYNGNNYDTGDNEPAQIVRDIVALAEHSEDIFDHLILNDTAHIYSDFEETIANDYQNIHTIEMIFTTKDDWLSYSRLEIEQRRLDILAQIEMLNKELISIESSGKLLEQIQYTIELLESHISLSLDFFSVSQNQAIYDKVNEFTEHIGFIQGYFEPLDRLKIFDAMNSSITEDLIGIKALTSEV